MSTRDAIELGIQDAHARLGNLPTGTKLSFAATSASYADEVHPALLPSITKALGDEPVSDHFARLFAELTTVAQSARYAYGEQQLTVEQLTLALDGFKAFLNSFGHL